MLGVGADLWSWLKPQLLSRRRRCVAAKKAMPKFVVHRPACKRRLTAVGAGMLPVTLGALAAGVAAGGGKLQHVWQRACVRVKMGLTGLASTALCGV